MSRDKSWPTRDKDLTIAKSVLTTHKFDPHNKMTLLKSYDIDEVNERISFSFPEWLIALAEALYQEHGATLFPFILSKVLEDIITDCVLDNKVRIEDAELFLVMVNTCLHQSDIATLH